MKPYIKAVYHAGIFLILARIWDYFEKTDYSVADFKIALFLMFIEVIYIYYTRKKNKKEIDIENKS